MSLSSKCKLMSPATSGRLQTLTRSVSPRTTYQMMSIILLTGVLVINLGGGSMTASPRSSRLRTLGWIDKNWSGVTLQNNWAEFNKSLFTSDICINRQKIAEWGQVVEAVLRRRSQLSQSVDWRTRRRTVIAGVESVVGVSKIWSVGVNTAITQLF